MKKLVVVSLGMLVVWSATLAGARPAETFELANRVGERHERAFFFFSTSAGNYAIRHDGWGEFTSPAKMRRVFSLKHGVRARIDRIYFLEHEGDVFLFCETLHGPSYLLRMEQKKRKTRWISEVASTGTPVMQGEAVVIETAEFSKADGRFLGH